MGEIEKKVLGRAGAIEMEKNKAGYTAVRWVPRRSLCTRHMYSPPALFTPLLLPPLNIPSIYEAKITRFREFKTKALRTDGPTDRRTDGRT